MVTKDATLQLAPFWFCFSNFRVEISHMNIPQNSVPVTKPALSPNSYEEALRDFNFFFCFCFFWGGGVRVLE